MILSNSDFDHYYLLIVNINSLFLSIIGNQSTDEKPELNEKVFGLPEILPEEVECEICYDCSCRANETVKVEEIIGFDSSKWIGLKDRNQGKTLIV